MKKLYLIGAGVLGEIVLFCVLREFQPIIGDDRVAVNLIFISLAYWVFLGQFIVPPVVVIGLIVTLVGARLHNGVIQFTIPV